MAAQQRKAEHVTQRGDEEIAVQRGVTRRMLDRWKVQARVPRHVAGYLQDMELELPRQTGRVAIQQKVIGIGTADHILTAEVDASHGPASGPRRSSR